MILHSAADNRRNSVTKSRPVAALLAELKVEGKSAGMVLLSLFLSFPFPLPSLRVGVGVEFNAPLDTV